MWCLDCEASGLHMTASYPIEIGYWNGETGDSFLITPHEDWTYWDPCSQEIHKISRSQLFEEGLPGPKACERLNLDLGGQTIYVDSDYDVKWLDTLFHAANIDKMFSVNVVYVHRPSNLYIEHRALADAKQMYSSLTSLTNSL